MLDVRTPDVYIIAPMLGDLTSDAKELLRREVEAGKRKIRNEARAAIMPWLVIGVLVSVYLARRRR